MFNPFKRLKRSDRRDIEQIIYDIAENGRAKDYTALYPPLTNRQVFIPIEPGSLPAHARPGYTLVTDDSTDIRVRLITGPDGKTYVPAATQDTADLLRDGYVGMNWIDFCEMVTRFSDTNGALLQGQKSWIAFDQKRVAHMIKKAKR